MGVRLGLFGCCGRHSTPPIGSVLLRGISGGIIAGNIDDCGVLTWASKGYAIVTSHNLDNGKAKIQDIVMPPTNTRIAGIL